MQVVCDEAQRYKASEYYTYIKSKLIEINKTIKGERRMIKKELKEVSIFFVATLFLSYFVFWGPIAISKVPTVNLVDGERGPVWAIVLFIIGGFIPSICGVILTRVFEGKKGIKELFKSSIQFKIGFKWFVFILLISLYYSFSLIFIYTIIGGKFDYSQFWIQLPTIIPLILLGPVSEELGWRGFAIKRLLKHLSPNVTSLIIGVIWSLWHLPLFHMVGTMQYEFNLSFAGFLIYVTFQSFVYTFVYIKTKGSIFSAILLHWFFTYLGQVVSSSIVRTDIYNWLEFLPSLLIGIVFVIILRNEKFRLKGSL